MAVSDTLDLEANGWFLQRPYTITPRYITASDQRDDGTVQTVAIVQKPFRDLSLRYRASTRAAYEYWMSFSNRLVGPAGRFNFQMPELVPGPDIAPVLDTITAGSQALRTISARFTWKNANGESLPSPTSSVAVAANDLVRVALPIYPPGVDQAVIYAAEDDAGNEESQVTLTTVRKWTQPDAALLTGTSSPPVVATATETSVFRIVSQKVTRGIAHTYELSLSLSES